MSQKLLNNKGQYDNQRGDSGAAWAITNPGAYTAAYDGSNRMTSVTRVLNGVTSVRTISYTPAGLFSSMTDWVDQ